MVAWPGSEQNVDPLLDPILDPLLDLLLDSLPDLFLDPHLDPYLEPHLGSRKYGLLIYIIKLTTKHDEVHLIN